MHTHWPLASVLLLVAKQDVQILDELQVRHKLEHFEQIAEPES